MDCLGIESTPSPAADQSTPAECHVTTPTLSNVMVVIEPLIHTYDMLNQIAVH